MKKGLAKIDVIIGDRREDGNTAERGIPDCIARDQKNDQDRYDPCKRLPGSQALNKSGKHVTDFLPGVCHAMAHLGRYVPGFPKMEQYCKSEQGYSRDQKQDTTGSPNCILVNS